MNKNHPLMGESLVNLIICYQKLANRINQAIEPLDMNMTQMSILNYFSWQPKHESTISQLVTVMEMNQPAVTKAVKAMVARGWMLKRQNENDARVFLVSITEQGMQQLNLARQVSTPLLEQTLGGLAENDLGQLNSLLKAVKTTLG
jgi:DNA-binding MarR family transcriptional regulator